MSVSWFIHIYIYVCDVVDDDDDDDDGGDDDDDDDGDDDDDAYASWISLMMLLNDIA